MGKKANAEPEVPAVPEDPPEESDLLPQEPPEPSAVLESLGWQVHSLAASGQRYYHSAERSEVRVQPPYYDILGLDENCFHTITKDDIWKAFFARRVEFMRAEPNGALSEDLKNPADKHDWALIMEAFHTLTDQDTRAAYEERNISSLAKQELVGLRVQHEVLQREAAAAAKREAAAAAARCASPAT
eukprot:TRINITY_DN12628_c0_g1_i1.p3 TRINITY_DN12628_c0_g1~~TRINITY_DN12628_c0_g1_i1.p3  ORF type:complete len:187 (+),score=54.33 TRINITY_DN12628_c0_g1_i1:94-654(+)